MKSSLRVFLSVLWCATALAACAKPDAPVAGRYRATLELSGGEAVLWLDITNEPQPHLIVVSDGQSLSGEIHIQNGELQATLPNRIGKLQAKFRNTALRGEWRLTDVRGQTITLPFHATLDADYRFIERSLTDNADVSGVWSLHAPPLTTEPTTNDAASSILQLVQTHDAVDGRLPTDGDSPVIFGQVHGDDIDFTVIGDAQVALFKGTVDKHGELHGKFWLNRDEAREWSAQRMTNQVGVTPDDATRKIAFPWAIPTQ